jgi:hypothetical protein
MSMLTALVVTAIATAVLALFAIVTAAVASLAFWKQRQDLREQQELLKVQAGQLETQRDQLNNQRALSARQTDVLDLQAAELRESLAERKRQAEERRRAQAALVYVTVETSTKPAKVGATIHNTSRQPIYDAHIHWIDTGKVAQAGEADQLGTVRPDASRLSVRDLPAGTAPSVFIPVAYFCDAGGCTWTLLPDGHLAPAMNLPAGASVIATTALTQARTSAGTSGADGQAIKSPESPQSVPGPLSH